MSVYHYYYKKIFSLKYKKKKFCLVNIRMINLSFDELRLIAQARNTSGYESKSKEDLIKALSEPKSEPLKPKISKLTTKTRNTKTRDTET